MLPPPLLPDLYAVAEQPQPQPPVRRRLMLQQYVHQHRRLGTLPLHRIQHVGLVAPPVVIHEATPQQAQRRPLQGVGERARHTGAQQAGGVLLVREHALEVLVVRLADRRLRRAAVRLLCCPLVGHDDPMANVSARLLRCQRPSPAELARQPGRAGRHARSRWHRSCRYRALPHRRNAPHRTGLLDGG